MLPRYQTIVSVFVTSLFLAGCVLITGAMPAGTRRVDSPSNAWAPKSTDWPTFHHGNDRTGMTDSTATMKFAYYKWTAKTGGQVRSSPAVATVNATSGGLMFVGAKVFVGSIDNRLYCIEGGTGRVLWRFQAASTISSSPAVGDLSGDGSPEVVFGSYDGRIYCIDCQNGSLVWRYTARSQIQASPALADLDNDGRLETAIGGLDGKFHVLDADGKALWTAGEGRSWDNVWASAAVGDVNNDGKIEVLVQTIFNNVTCFDGADGRVLWTYTALSGEIITWPFGPVIADMDGDGDAEVLVLGKINEASCLEGADGSVVWHQTYGWTLTSTPAIGDGDGDGKPEIFISADNTVFCAGGSDGVMKWSKTFSSPSLSAALSSSPALADLDGDGRLEILACANDVVFRALNAEDGTTRWAYPVPKPVESSPAIADIDADGKAEVVFGCDDQKVYALDYNF
jgi:outer membrane protein assembly factor BamB